MSPACEVCGAPDAKPTVPIGGGCTDLCDACAARLCECGAYVLPPTAEPGGTLLYPGGDATHHSVRACFDGQERIPRRTWGPL